MAERLRERAVVWEIPRFFGIRIEGNEYEPLFSCDDVVYVDSGIIPEPDEICFVILGRKACFRLFEGSDGRQTRFTRINDFARHDVIGSESPSQPIMMRVMGSRRARGCTRCGATGPRTLIPGWLAPPGRCRPVALPDGDIAHPERVCLPVLFLPAVGHIRKRCGVEAARPDSSGRAG
jgi:hypothetical protein